MGWSSKWNPKIGWWFGPRLFLFFPFGAPREEWASRWFFRLVYPSDPPEIWHRHGKFTKQKCISLPQKKRVFHCYVRLLECTPRKSNIDTKNDEPWLGTCIFGFKHGIILGIDLLNLNFGGQWMWIMFSEKLTLGNNILLVHPNATAGVKSQSY